MAINCSDFLFLQKYADFFVFDKRSAYLYPIDHLHYEIGLKLQDAFRKKNVVLNVNSLVQQWPNYEVAIILEHYDFIYKLLSEDDQPAASITPISQQDIKQSLAIVPQILIEVTERCNFRCDYCYYGEMYDAFSNREERIHDMPEEDCLKCLRELLSIRDLMYDNKVVVSFYGGEPLLNFRLIRTIVLFCKEEFPEIEYQFRMTTNGSLLRAHIEFLEKHDFHILVSLDGDEQSNVHRRYKDGSPSFFDVSENVASVYREHREYFEKNIEFISVLQRESNIVSICRLFSKYNKTPILTNLLQEGVALDNQVVFPYPGVEQSEMSALFETNREVYDLINRTSKSAMSIELQDAPSCLPINPDIKGCFLFSNKIYLAVDRQIYLCEKASRKFPFGSFSQGHLKFYIDDINHYYKEFDNVVKKKCVGCSMHYLCKRCFFEDPSLRKSTIKCRMTDKDMEKALNYTLSHE